MALISLWVTLKRDLDRQRVASGFVERAADCWIVVCLLLLGWWWLVGPLPNASTVQPRPSSLYIRLFREDERGGGEYGQFLSKSPSTREVGKGMEMVLKGA